MVEKSVENNGIMIRVAFNEVSTHTKGMFELQDSKIQNLADSYLKRLDDRFNDIDHGVESNFKLVLQKADKINGALDFVKNDQQLLWAKFDEQLKYMKTKKEFTEVFPDNVDKEPKHVNQERSSFFEKNTTLQNDANPGLANTPGKNNNK
jgi:CRISPR/Cas system-associated endonuclease/helicase Cas3